MVYPPGFEGSAYLSNLLDDVAANLKDTYAEVVRVLEEGGYTRKQAREAARAFLPNAQETRIVVTGNHRAWREFVQKRNSPHADAEIRLLAQEVLKSLKLIAPNTYQDMT